MFKEKVSCFTYYMQNYCFRFIKAWDYFCLSADGYTNGWKDAERIAKLENPDMCPIGHTLSYELDRVPGDHQIGHKSTGRHDNLTRERFIDRLEYDFNVKISDLQFEDNNGIISIKGTLNKYEDYNNG